MAKDRLSKKDMQTDELQHALVDASDYVASHKSQSVRLAVAGVGAVVLVAAIWGGLVWRSNKYAKRLSQTLALLDAPLVTEGASPLPGQRVFKDAAERTAELKKELKALASDAPSSEAGRTAALMLASLEGGKGPSGAALQAVQSLAQGSGFTAAVAALAGLETQAANGQVKEAIATGKKYLDGGSPLPKDYLLFTLGGLSEKAGQFAEAKTFYNRLVSDFPESALRFEASQKITEL